MKVAVVGAGVVGAAVAYYLARDGAEVLLLDAGPAPAEGVTGASFGWVGGPTVRDAVDASTPLRRLVLREHRRLEREVPGYRVRWCGSLGWDGSLPGDAAPGPDEEILDAAAVQRLEPRLRTPPSRALRRPTDGAADPVGVTRALVDAAARHGARVRLRERIDALPTGADAVVVAAGTGVPALCAPLGLDVPVEASPALLASFAAPPGLVRGIIVAPRIEVREGADGVLMAALEHAGEATASELERRGEAVLDQLRELLDGADRVRLVDVRLGLRPMPADGLPMVGGVPGLPGVYLAVMHSGITLAPVAGRLLAREVIERVRVPELDGVRPDAPGRQTPIATRTTPAPL